MTLQCWAHSPLTSTLNCATVTVSCIARPYIVCWQLQPGTSALIISDTQPFAGHCIWIQADSVRTLTTQTAQRTRSSQILRSWYSCRAKLLVFVFVQHDSMADPRERVSVFDTHDNWLLCPLPIHHWWHKSVHGHRSTNAYVGSCPNLVKGRLDTRPSRYIQHRLVYPQQTQAHAHSEWWDTQVRQCQKMQPATACGHMLCLCTALWHNNQHCVQYSAHLMSRQQQTTTTATEAAKHHSGLLVGLPASPVTPLAVVALLPVVRRGPLSLMPALVVIWAFFVVVVITLGRPLLL